MNPNQQADRNVRSFLIFRIAFNARFYYPVLAILFLDLGLSLEQYALLNVAWAASIVCLEVPSGALADLLGRKKLVVTAALLMVVEMLVFGFVPTDNVQLLFVLFMANRVLSGAAEASASGADEALVYDSLRNANREKEWPKVLESLGRWQSVAFFFAMIVGAAVYDPNTFRVVGNALGFEWEFAASSLVRMPIYLTLILSFVACAASFMMYEAPIERHEKPNVKMAFAEVFKTARWIVDSPVAFFVIFATLCNDSIIRLFMTLSSQYYRILQFPEYAFGIIGSVSALLGFVSPTLAQQLMKLGTPRRAFAGLSAAVLVLLSILPITTEKWGLGFAFALGLAMGVAMYLASSYLNEVAEPSRRATTLSFKGLTGNVAYGGAGLFFAGLLKSVAHKSPSATENEVFMQSLSYLPWVFLGMILLAYLVRAFQKSTALSEK